MIENLWTQSNQGIAAWKTVPVPDVILHIVGHYHLKARLEMARMESLAEQAVLLEGAEHPVLVQLRDEIWRFCRDFRTHMTLEERTLFPYLLDPGAGARGRGGLVPPVVKLLEDEHQAETDLFQRLLALSDACPPAAGARSLRRRLNRSLAAMEKALHRHILLETQVLFRRIL